MALTPPPITDDTLDRLRDAAELHRLAIRKADANDAAFDAYLSGDEGRSRRSLAASASGRARAFEYAAGDADRAFYGLPASMIDRLLEHTSVPTLEERLELVEQTIDATLERRVGAQARCRIDDPGQR